MTAYLMCKLTAPLKVKKKRGIRLSLDTGRRR
jgi:hypothetical protein